MNRQKIIKFISLVLVLILIISISNLNQLCLAKITPSSKGIINVSNIEEGVNVVLYKIATMEYDYNLDQPKEGYSWSSGVQEWINTNYPLYKNTENFYNAIETNSTDAQDFYDKLTAGIKGGTISISEKASMPSTNGVAVFTEVEMGTYLVIIEDGYMVYRPSVVNVAPTYENGAWVIKDQDVVIKASNPQITKKITNNEKTVDNYSIIDKITYTIEANIPKYLENSLSKIYRISDKIDNSLEIDVSSLTVSGITKEGDSESIIGHTIKWDKEQIENLEGFEELDDTENLTFLINFIYENISSYEKIVITYDAKLKKEASLNIDNNENNNYAYLEYSNNPYDASSIKKQSAEKVTVYTYGIEILSRDTNSETKLAGSEFILRDKDKKEMYFILADTGKYYLAKSTDAGATTNLVVDENGNLNLYGLDEGNYFIEQTKAPAGYNISSKLHEIELIDNGPDGILDEGTDSFIFQNTKGFTLPLTGGKGTVLLLSLSIVLIGIGILMLILLDKKDKAKK